jgi:hypothetical protein
MAALPEEGREDFHPGSADFGKSGTRQPGLREPWSPLLDEPSSASAGGRLDLATQIAEDGS